MKKILLIAFILAFATLKAQESATLIPYRKGEKFGFVDKNKKKVIAPIFFHAYPFGYSHQYAYHTDYARVYFDEVEGLFLVDKKGKVISEADFDKKNKADYEPIPRPATIDEFGWFKSFETEDNKKGLLDQNNNIILKPIYDYLDLFSFDRTYYDKQSKQYRRATFASVKEGDKSFIIRLDKYKVYDTLVLSSFDAHSNYVIVSINNEQGKVKNYGILTSDNLIVLDPKYISVQVYYEEQGLISVNKVINEHPVTIYIDLEGNEYYEE